MSRAFFRKYLLTEQALRNHKHLGRLAPLFRHPNLFHLNRHSVAKGIAFGAIGGLIPGPLQMLTAAGLSILFHGNLAVAVFVTFYTNPLTIVPIYLLAYRIGSGLLGGQAGALNFPEVDWSVPLTTLQHLGSWAMSLGLPLVIGLLILVVGLALLGYFGTHALWRAGVVLRWRRRQRRRQQDLGQSKR